ncbi:MAG: tol-pal system protein YbgF, partial [Burkholderiales bacterium]|nr:tol-pal system protein YbgF [Burkholderiales bacterium]
VVSAASAPATGAGGPPGGANTAIAPAPSAPDPFLEQRTYDAAHQLRRIGNFAGAISAFQSFIKTWPKSRLAPAAQYWIGDSHFNLREYRVAIASQRQLIATWPDNEKVPDAMLNIASSQAELGDSAAARRTLEELVTRHPLSEAADRARRRLAARK